MCGFYIYTSQYLKENFTVRCIIFSLRTGIGKQTITFFATNNNNPIFHYKYKRYSNLQLFSLKKKKTNSGSKTQRVCPFQNRGELFHFLDKAKLTFSVRIRIKSRKQTTESKRSKLNWSGYSAVFRAQVTEKEQHTAHCKTGEILEFYTLQTGEILEFYTLQNC